MNDITIPLRSHDEAILVLGPYDRYARLLREECAIDVTARDGNLRLSGGREDVTAVHQRIEHLLGKHRKGRALEPSEIEKILLGPRPGQNGERRSEPDRSAGAPALDGLARGVKTRAVEPRTENQRRYQEAMLTESLTFGLGVAGTGKTYLAVASAVRALREGEVRRMIITRPVVEAGEHLGFLPGDLQAKLNPYLRPVHDALSDLLHFEDLSQLQEAGVVEIAPLAYMRGRTLSNAFVILDEAQNTTVGQMKMFLTRLGENSRMVVTGDPTQTDLPRGVTNGLADGVRRLRGYEGVGVVEFDLRDIVRHPLVEKIVRAYESPARESDASGDRS